MRRVSILGATGSIGQNTLNLISQRKDQFQVVALTGSRNIELLAQSAIDFNAVVVGIADDRKLNDV